MKALVIAISVVAVLAGGAVAFVRVTADSPAPDPPTRQSPVRVAVIHPVDVIANLRKQGELEVTAVHEADVVPLFAVEAVEATVDGVPSVIVTFGNIAGRAAWQDMVLTFGSAAVVGTGTAPKDLWGVNPDSGQGGADLADKIAQRLGGTIRAPR